MVTITKRLTEWSFVLVLLGLAGCQSTETFFRGYKADNESASPLVTTAEQQGHWKTFDIDLNYRYSYADHLLDISGTVDMGFFYEMNTKMIRSITVYLFFLDTESTVMETVRLDRSGIFRPEERLNFSKKLKVPSGTAAIAFGYDGEALEDNGVSTFEDQGRGGGGLHIFSILPRRPR